MSDISYLTFTRMRTGAVLIVIAVGSISLQTALAIPNSVPAVNGNISRDLLGDGTGIRLAIIDSGMDVLHPGLAGIDSQGNPRLVAQMNWVAGGGPAGNTGDDVHGHGTHVGGIALSSHVSNRGWAPDARYINARVLNQNAAFGSTEQVINGAGWAIDQGANVMNLSLNRFAAGGDYTSLEGIIDWAAYNRGISAAVCAGNISQAEGGATGVRSPAYSYNAMSVAHTTFDYSRVHFDASMGPTVDLRSKPDIAAPGTNILSLKNNWEGASADFGFRSGCSMATPQVAGMMTQTLEYANTRGAASLIYGSPLVVKSAIMTSALPVLNKLGNPWEPGAMSLNGGVQQVTRPLDTNSGAGQIDGERLSRIYLSGRHTPGNAVPIAGLDRGNITGTGTSSLVTYAFERPLAVGEILSATLTWFRHVTRTDNSPFGQIDASDAFLAGDGGAHLNLDNLDLRLVRLGPGAGTVVESVSNVDNVEHIKFSITEPGDYALQVVRLPVADTGNGEQYGLTWYVPEPSSAAILMLGGLLTIRRKRR
ncbi:MAG TPA: S8 family serine peptidase [Phycisphaerae bacterium]|nr:S8 family serine peptidase [Phycisphaerae bacterium]